VVQLGEHVAPSQFGISSAEAARAGLTITSGVTPAFWIFCAFVVALIAMCVGMLLPEGRPALTDSRAATTTFS
jgi:Na+/proline symporter